MKRRKTLADSIPDRKLEKFLLNIVNANLEETRDEATRLFGLYGNFLPTPPSTPEEAARLLPVFGTRWAGPNHRLQERPKVYARGIMLHLREWLRAVWDTDNEESAEWRRSRLESELNYAMATGPNLQPPTPDAPICQALSYLHRRLRLLKRCANPSCETPFFIAARKEQPSCGAPLCVAAVQGQSQSKRWKQIKLTGRSKVRLERFDSDAPRVKGSRRKAEATIPESELKKFVIKVANADEERVEGSTQYFFDRYPDFFPTRDQDIQSIIPLFRRRWTTLEGLRTEVPQIYYRSIIRELRDGFRAVWQTEDQSFANWRLFQLQSSLHALMDTTEVWQDKALQPPPKLAPIHQALHWVRQHLPKLRKCGIPDCRYPFFVATGKERFCSSGCVAASQRLYRRNWWKKRGAEWRAMRSKQQSRRRKCR
jgi:hypothetical protein